MPAPAPLLELRGVSVGYDQTDYVLDDVFLSVHKGEVLAVASLDAHGGKSTLLRVAAGLLPPTRGHVSFEGRDLYEMSYGEDQRLRERMAVVPEGGALVANLRVCDNVGLPLRYHQGLRGEPLERRIKELLRLAGFNEDPRAFPSQVSGRGQRLAAFARALARDPELILVDRFFEGLEMPDWKRLFELVMELNQNRGVTWLLVSELDSAIFTVAERVAVLERGRVLACGHKRTLFEDQRIRAAFAAATLEQQRSSDELFLFDDSAPFQSEDSEDLGVALPGQPRPAARAPAGAEETITIDGYVPPPPPRGPRKRAASPVLPRPAPAEVEETITIDGFVPPPPPPSSSASSEASDEETPA
jgi:phospholipid/cholesterol/gamma-HCH transport system ATP-binding protein